MKNFLLNILAVIIGIFLANIIMFFFFFVFMIGIATSIDTKDGVEVKNNSILKLDLGYSIPDKNVNPFDDFDLFNLEVNRRLGLNEVLHAIKKAKDDPKIKGILLSTAVFPSGMAKLDEIRSELVEFKESGKFIVSNSEVYTQKAFILASVADSIFMTPGGYLEFKGLSADVMFMRKMLENIGVKAQVIYAGDYKSATEPFRLDSMSDENREQLSELIYEFYDHMIGTIGEGRSIDEELLDSLADNFIVRNDRSAKEHGFIDEILYSDQVSDLLKDMIGIEHSEDLELIGLSSYAKTAEKNRDRGSKDQKIAVVYAEGAIVDGSGEDGEIGSKDMVKVLRKIRKDEDIKAVVLRVNSPGGSSMASDVMWRELSLIKEKMPLVVSMGDVAASGGYYIACAADTIVAGPQTITGSIGVFMMLPDISELNEGLGFSFDTVSTSRFADMPTVSRPLTAEERDILQFEVERVYDDFLTRVSDGRSISKDAVHQIAQGRVWTGQKAKENGLVDVLGDLERSIEIASAMAGLEDHRIVEYPKEKDPFQEIMKEFGSEIRSAIITEDLEELRKIATSYQNVESMQGMQMRLPFEIDVH